MSRPLTLIILALAAPALAAEPEQFTSKDGRFTATFPGKPAESARDVDTAGGKVKLTSVTLEIRKDLAYIVMFNDYPEAVAPDQAQDVLGRVRDGTKGTDGKVLSDSELALGKDKVPGRDYVISQGDNHFFRARSYLNGRRLYQVIISAAKKDDVTSKEAEAFLDSFAIAP